MGRSVGEPDIYETGNEQEHYVTEFIMEDADHGNVRISAYRVIHGNQWHLADSWLIPETVCTTLGRQLLCRAAEARDVAKGKFTQ